MLNKIDQITIEELDILNKMPDVVPVSGFHKWNLDELLEKIWDKLDLIRMCVHLIFEFSWLLDILNHEVPFLIILILSCFDDPLAQWQTFVTTFTRLFWKILNGKACIRAG